MKFYFNIESNPMSYEKDIYKDIDERYDRIVKRLTKLYKASEITEDCYLDIMDDLNIMRDTEKRARKGQK